MNPDAELLTRAEADHFLSLPAGFLENLAKQGRGPAYWRLTRKMVQYSRSELLAWRDSRRITPPMDI
jgi:hypothetical protein